MSLTDTAIKTLKPKASRYKVFDGGGLYLEVLPTGSKVWRIKYRENGKDRRHTVGHYSPAYGHDRALDALLKFPPPLYLQRTLRISLILSRSCAKIIFLRYLGVNTI